MRFLVFVLSFAVMTKRICCQYNNTTEESVSTTVIVSSFNISDEECMNATESQDTGEDYRLIVIIASSTASTVAFIMCLCICAHYLVYMQIRKQIEKEKENVQLVEMYENSMFYGKELGRKLKAASERRGVSFYTLGEEDILDLPPPLPEQQDQDAVEVNVGGQASETINDELQECVLDCNKEADEERKDDGNPTVEIMVENKIYKM